MKPVQSITDVTLNVTNNELLEGKWLHFQLLSKKLGELEQSQNTAYKQLRNKFYNSCACNKYNVKDIAGLKCIDVDNPMATESASLVIKFKRG